MPSQPIPLAVAERKPPASYQRPTPQLTSSSPPAFAARPFRSAKTVVILVAILAAALVVVAALLGAFSGRSPGSAPGAGSGTIFSSARAVADRFAAAHGAWNLTKAVGLASQAGFTLPYNDTSAIPNCTLTALAGSLSTNLPIPGFVDSLVSGNASVWAFVYWSPATGAALVIFELSGHVELAVEESTGCAGPGAISPGTIPGSVVDSTTAVSAASAAGGAAFLTAHPTGVSLTMTLNGTLNYSTSHPSTDTTWDIQWSTCSATLLGYSSTSTYGYAFSVEINASSGSALPYTAMNSTCGMSRYGTLGLSVELGSLYQGVGAGGTIASQGCTSGDYCYSVFIAGSYANVTPANFSESVWNMSDAGTTYDGTVGFAILDATGGVIVYSLGPVESQWTSGVGTSDTLLTAGMSFTVDMGTADPGAGSWALALTGEGDYFSAGTFAVGL